MLKLVAIEERPVSLVRAFAASLGGNLGRQSLRGVHFEQANEITIESDSSERHPRRRNLPRRDADSPIHLQLAHPLSFVKLAA